MEFVKSILRFPSQVITYLVVIVGFVIPFNIFMRVFNRTEVRGRRIVQQTRPPFLFVSNHVSMLDDAFVGPLVFIPRAIWDYRFIPFHLPEKKNFFRGPFFSWLMRTVRCIPLTRGQGVFQPGMEETIRILKEGGTVHVFPEGTRTRSGDLGKGKIGVGRMVRETGAKVIPCYHTGLNQVLPIGHKIPRIGKRVRIQVGEVLTFEEYMNMPNTPKTWQLISNRIIDSIRDIRDKMRRDIST
jgi:monolysocardiolipin acyltransferase